MTENWYAKPNNRCQFTTANAWQPLNFLNLYRLGLSGLFFVFAMIDQVSPPFGHHSPVLLMCISAFYLIFSLLANLGIRWQWAHYKAQVHFHLLTDLAVITLLMHSSGGPSSGLGMLLLMPVASGSILAHIRKPAFFPAAATLMLLAEQIYGHYEGLHASSFTHAALLGVSLFAVSIVTQVWVARIHTSEDLAAQRSVDLANLAQLNEQIVHNMRSGVVVVDAGECVHLINRAAWYLLGMPNVGYKPQLRTVSADVSLLLKQWQTNPEQTLDPFCAKPTYPKVAARFTQLGKNDARPGTVIFLEDSTALAQQAQQMKLASLGRLTANIAHEIRNPLSAISHAGQLLAESAALAATDKRLTQIICQQCQRVNTIIENILQLSRKDRCFPIEIDLLAWLEEFREEFCLSQDIDMREIAIEVEPATVSIKADQTQLQQVLVNLCQNGLRHSPNDAEKPKLILRGGRCADLTGPFLEVIDHGSGIDHAVAEHIFEPFYTTDSAGTGLGLFIARELCQCNRASLDYLSIASGGSCFRISFIDPQRPVA